MKRVPHRLLIVPAAAALVAAASGLISPANAQTFSSSYTSTAPKDCRTIGKPRTDGSTTQVCPGKSGLVVLISEDDLRQTVSVGPNHVAASQGAGRGVLVRARSIPPPTPSNGGRWTASRSRSFSAG